MKKKLLVFAMAGVMTASMLTACGGKETTATTTAAVETTTAAVETTKAAEVETTTAGEAETTKAEAANAEEDKILTNYDEYLGWTKKEWAEANDEEKENAAIVYSLYATEAIAGQEFDAETKALTVAQFRETGSADIKNVVSQLDATLPTLDTMSLKEFADMGVEQINSMAGEAAAE